MKVSNVLGSFLGKITPKINLANAFKRLFRDDSFKPCSKIVGFLWEQGLGCWGGARQREAKGRKAWSLPRT